LTFTEKATTELKEPKVLALRQQRQTFSADAYKEKTPEQKAALAKEYDGSLLLAAARIEARLNVIAWRQGKPLSFEAANRFANTQDA